MRAVNESIIKKPANLRKEVRKVIKDTGVFECNLIIDAIKYANQVVLKSIKESQMYLRKNKKKKIDEVMLISSWDRISKCYVDNYSEIFDFGLPFFSSLKKDI